MRVIIATGVWAGAAFFTFASVADFLRDRQAAGWLSLIVAVVYIGFGAAITFRKAKDEP